MIFSIDNRTRRNRSALIDGRGDAAWTYEQLVDEVSKRRDWLGCAPKGLLFLFCRNDLSSIAWYLGALEGGHAVALLNGQIDGQMASNLITLYQPEWLAGDLDCRPEPYTAEDAHGLRCRMRQSGAGEVVEIHPELALLLSTSGSTGSPKFVRLRRSSVEANAESIREALSIVESDVPVAHLPMHYSYGLSVINSHLLTGASIVLSQEGLVSREFWDTIRRHRVDSFSGVPYTYQMMRRLGLESVNAPTLRIMTQAGGKLDNGNIAHFHACMTQRDGSFYVMYGQTEATARISVLPSVRLPEKLGSAGQAISGGTIRIHDGDGNPLNEPGSEGELVYAGPNVMMGYATRREDLAKGDEINGRLFTGDRARLDSEGFVYVLGRSKRDAKVFGLRINLDELETMVKRSGPAAAVGTADHVIIFCEFGDEAVYREICASLAATLKIHRSAFEFRRIDSLPTKNTGKVDYESLMARL